MITRSNAYDIVAPPEGMKDFCRLMPCPTAAERTKDFSRIDFGWLGHFGSKAAGPDVWEYIASRAAAWDCPLSLKLAPSEVVSNPRGEDCLDAIRIWEDARLGNHLTDSQRDMLRNVRPEDAHYVPCFDQRAVWEEVVAGRGLTPVQQRILADRREHHLFVNEQGEYELVPTTEVPVAGEAIKAFCFRRELHPDKVYVLLWAVDSDVELRLPIASDLVQVMRPFGTLHPIRRLIGETVVTIGGRSYLVLKQAATEEAVRILGQARCATGKAASGTP